MHQPWNTQFSTVSMQQQDCIGDQCTRSLHGYWYCPSYLTSNNSRQGCKFLYSNLHKMKFRLKDKFTHSDADNVNQIWGFLLNTFAWHIDLLCECPHTLHQLHFSFRAVLSWSLHAAVKCSALTRPVRCGGKWTSAPIGEFRHGRAAVRTRHRF